MLDIQFIRQNADQVRAAITNKRLDLDLDELLAADKERREATTTLEQKRARKNELSALIPKASKDDRPKLVEEAKQIRDRHRAARAAARRGAAALPGPHAPRAEHPAPRGARSARARRTTSRSAGRARRASSTSQPKDHVELMTALGLVDWDGPRKFAGGRSYALVGRRRAARAGRACASRSTRSSSAG